eukprot:scaffold6161_cov146-Skeletonema_menzelii.AAC.9
MGPLTSLSDNLGHFHGQNVLLLPTRPFNRSTVNSLKCAHVRAAHVNFSRRAPTYVQCTKYVHDKRILER